MRKSTKNRRNLAIQNSLIPLSDDGEWWTTLQIEKILAGIDKLMADQKVNSMQTQKFDWASRVALGHIDVEPWMQISLSEYPAVTRALIDRVSQIHGKQGATLTGMWIMQTMQQPRRKTEFAATCTFEKCLYVIESKLNLSENKNALYALRVGDRSTD